MRTLTAKNMKPGTIFIDPIGGKEMTFLGYTTNTNRLNDIVCVNPQGTKITITHGPSTKFETKGAVTEARAKHLSERAAKIGRPIQNIELGKHGISLTDDGMEIRFHVNGPKAVAGRTATLNLDWVEVGEFLLKIQAGVDIAAQIQALENWSA